MKGGKDLVAVPVRRIQQPSLVHMAAEAVREMILSGQLRPGDKLGEEALTEGLGISRPPFREALRLLEREGLVINTPRHGVVVTPLTAQDVFEVFTLRTAYERLAVELGIPVRSKERIGRVRNALDGMAEAARTEDRAGLVKSAFEFHIGVVGLAGHRRLEDGYRALWLQMHLFMAVDTRVREQFNETLEENVDRHRRLLALIEAGDPKLVLAELETHGDRTFFEEMTKGVEDASARGQRDG